MNKYVKLGLCIIIPIATISVLIFVLFKTGVLGKQVDEEVDTIVQTLPDGRTFTSREDKWKPADSKNVEYKTEAVTNNTRFMKLWLKGNLYYDMELPSDYSYEYDFLQTLREVNGKCEIKIYSDVQKETLSEILNIKSPQSLTSNVVCTGDDKRGEKVIAAIIRDTSYAVVIKVYDDDVLYSTFRSILVNDDTNAVTKTVEVESPKPKASNRLQEVSYAGTYGPSINYNTYTSIIEKNLFANGEMYLQTLPVQIQDLIDRYIVYGKVLSGQDDYVFYDGDKIFYAEFGDYVVGLFVRNSNTTVAMLGYGEEAKCNIVDIINKN